MRDGAGAADRDRWLGVALLILGGLILVVKLLGWSVVQAALRFWPAALILIGWQMYRRADREAGGKANRPAPDERE